MRHNVGALIKEAGQNAKLVEGWLTQVPTIVNNQLAHYENLAHGFFVGLEGTVNNDIGNLMKRFGNTTLGPSSSQSLDGLQTGHGHHRTIVDSSAPLSLVTGATLDIENFLYDIKHNWLLDKIISLFTGDQTPAINTDLQNALNQMVTVAEDAFHFVKDMATLLWDGLKDLFNSKGGFNATTYTQLFTQLQKTVDDLLQFADAVVKLLVNLAEVAMDQLGSMLSHKFNEIPLVGSLLQHFGLDDTMTVAHLVSLILMYPATLANQIKNGTNSSLFPSTSSTGDKLSSSPNWGPGLQISAAIGQGIWGFADAVGDAFRAGGEEAPGAIGWIDIVCHPQYPAVARRTKFRWHYCTAVRQQHRQFW